LIPHALRRERPAPRRPFGVFGRAGGGIGLRAPDRSSTGGFDLGVVTGGGRAQVRDASSIFVDPGLAHRVLQDRS
jgi:hypothetical protein